MSGAEERRSVTLSKAHRDTVVGRQLIELLRELSGDGNVSREEMDRLRGWLEIDHGADFPALPFLHETIEQISSDGEVTEDELDRLALAIERVLPKDIRADVAAKRRQAREARRAAQREAFRARTIAARAARKAARDSERMRAGILYESEFPVRGAFRFAERREACERLVEGDAVNLEREPNNPHGSTAILVLNDDDCELGYVPSEESVAIAPLMDAGADATARVCRIWETPDDCKLVPILRVKVRRGDADPGVQPVATVRRTGRQRNRGSSSTRAEAAGPGCGCMSALVVSVVVLLFLVLIGVTAR